jgi:hypothetical protein
MTCGICTMDSECGLPPLGGCSHNACINNLCQVVITSSQGTTCPQAQATAATCDANGMCVQAKFVFVTKDAFSSSFGAGGVAGADMACQHAATLAGLGGMWVSWTSDDTSGALSRVTANQSPLPTPYELLDGTVVVLGAAGLTGTAISLMHGIDMDEKMGSQSSVPVWTGSNTMGAFSGEACANWTGGADGGVSESMGTVGSAGSTTSTWATEGPQSCSAIEAHLYCFMK